MRNRRRWYLSPCAPLLGLVLVGLAACGETDCDFQDPVYSDGSSTTPVVCPDDMALADSVMTIPVGLQARVRVVRGNSQCPVTWSIDTPAVARVQGGNVAAVVTGLEAGETVLRSYRGGGQSGPTAVCTLTVTPNTFVSLSMTPDSLTFDTANPSAEYLKVKLVDAEGRRVPPPDPIAWTNSDSTAAFVAGLSDTMALVLSLSAGQTLITATYEGLGAAGAVLSDTCLVTVLPAEEP